MIDDPEQPGKWTSVIVIVFFLALTAKSPPVLASLYAWSPPRVFFVLPLVHRRETKAFLFQSNKQPGNPLQVEVCSR